MEKYTDKVKNFIEQYQLIEKGDHILIGLSGGADSVCLLLMLNELKKEYGITLHALHLEHGIRGEDSRQDAKFSKELCAEIEVDFQMVSVDVPKLSKERKMSLEEAGRAARYEAFGNRCRELEEDFAENVKLAVAHHGNDNAETLLFNLARGSGLNGACGINPASVTMDDICVIRPLLCLKRTEIEDYLKELGQSFCTDSTNLETDYTRNKIRHKIIPELEEINDRAVEHLLGYSDEMRDIKDFLDTEVEKCLDELAVFSPDKVTVNIAGLMEKHSVLIDRTLKKVLVRISGQEKDLTKQHVAQLRGLMFLQSGRHIDLPYDVTAIREYDNIVFSKKVKGEKRTLAEASVPDLEEMFIIRHFRMPEDGVQCLEIPKKAYTKWFDYDKIRGGLFVRCAQKTDKIVIDSEGHTKSVFDYLKNEKVSSNERKNTYVLCDEKEVLWVIGYRISERYKITENTKNVIELDHKIQKG